MLKHRADKYLAYTIEPDLARAPTPDADLLLGAARGAAAAGQLHPRQRCRLHLLHFEPDRHLDTAGSHAFMPRLCARRVAVPYCGKRRLCADVGEGERDRICRSGYSPRGRWPRDLPSSQDWLCEGIKAGTFCGLLRMTLLECVALVLQVLPGAVRHYTKAVHVLPFPYITHRHFVLAQSVCDFPVENVEKAHSYMINRHSDAVEMIRKFTFDHDEIMNLLIELERTGYDEWQAACNWLQANPAIWKDWVSEAKCRKVAIMSTCVLESVIICDSSCRAAPSRAPFSERL
eukprot:6201167-Pleurochrysis_carterae.AAC.6